MATDDTVRQLEIAFTATDAAHRLAARRAFALDQARTTARAIDTARAEVDTARTTDAAAAAGAAAVRVITARGDAERSYVAPFMPAERTAVIHGRVHGDDGGGIADLTVRATGPDGNTLEGTTDRRGYFRIDLVGAERRPLPTLEGTGTTLPRIAVRLGVFSGTQELLAERGTTLVRPGRSVYRELLVKPA
jgi:hypothetical protein